MQRVLKLGVDLDGVVADYVSFFRGSVAKRLGISEEQIGPQTTWSFTQSGWGIETDEQYRQLHKAAVMEDRMFANMAQMHGASEVLWRLSNREVHITIITHRLCVNWGHGIAAGDTVTWLDSNAIPYRDICFIADKPTVDVDAYIDDAPHNIAALQAAKGKDRVIIFDAPYNRHVDGLRAHDWLEVEQHVERIISELNS